MDEYTRNRLYEIYNQLDGLVTELDQIIRQECKPEYQRAKAYWLASLSVGLSNEQYCTLEPTFSNFLKSAGIMDENGDYVEATEDEDELDEIY